MCSNLKGLFLFPGDPCCRRGSPISVVDLACGILPHGTTRKLNRLSGKILDDMFLLTFWFCSHFYCKNPDFVNLKIVKKLRSGVPTSLPILDELHVTFTPVAHFPNNKGGLFEY